jgi:hypothetical protein
MGYHKQQYLDDCYVDDFIESAKSDELDMHFPHEEGTFTTRHMPIDTRGNFEDQQGFVYDLGHVNVFVPDHVHMMIQPIVEPKSATYPTARPANDNQDVGYHNLRMSDL